MSIGITVLLIFTMCICCVNKVSVSADSVTVNHQKINRSGKVFKIKGNTIYFRERKGSSPEKWGKMQKAKMTASTKFYKMTKFDADCKAKKGNVYKNSITLSILEDYGDTDSMLAEEIENLSIEMIDEKEK